MINDIPLMLNDLLVLFNDVPLSPSDIGTFFLLFLWTLLTHFLVFRDLKIAFPLRLNILFLFYPTYMFFTFTYILFSGNLNSGFNAFFS